MDSSGNFLFYYNLAVVTAALFQGFYVPFSLFFVETTGKCVGGLDEGQRLWDFLNVLQVIADIIFYGDMIFGFFTSYFESSIGEFIYNPKKIALHYLGDSFLLNCLATVHWGFICEKVFQLDTDTYSQVYTLLRYLKLLKLVEVINLMYFLKGLNLVKETKALFFIMYYLLLIFIYCHFFGCIFWFVLR